MVSELYEELDWTEESVSAFWDYESRFPQRYFTYQFGDVIARKLRRHLAGRPSVLDYGCGPGFLMSHLIREGALVTGCDFSAKSVERAKARLASKENFRGAFVLDELLGRGAKFDVVLVVEVIEHLYDDQLLGTLGNIRKLLAPNGVVIFTTPNDEDLLESFLCCPSCRKIFHRFQHVRSWTPESLERYLAERGFRTLESFTTDFCASFRKNKYNFFLRLLKPHAKKPHLVSVCAPSSNLS